MVNATWLSDAKKSSLHRSKFRSFTCSTTTTCGNAALVVRKEKTQLSRLQEAKSLAWKPEKVTQDGFFCMAIVSWNDEDSNDESVLNCEFKCFTYCVARYLCPLEPRSCLEKEEPPPAAAPKKKTCFADQNFMALGSKKTPHTTTFGGLWVRILLLCKVTPTKTSWAVH